MFSKARSLVNRIKKTLLNSQKEDAKARPEEDEEEQEIACCGKTVHIAYRGLADDRMYISYDRTWKEVRFFRPNGLRVFCAACRKRVY